MDSKMIERLGCQTCRDIIQRALYLVTAVEDLEKRVEDLRRPVLEKNKARQKRNRWYRSIPLLGRLVGQPYFYPEPTKYKTEKWYKEIRQKIQNMSAETGEIALLKTQDLGHWGDDENRKISQEVVDIFIGKGCSRQRGL